MQQNQTSRKRIIREPTTGYVSQISKVFPWWLITPPWKNARFQPLRNTFSEAAALPEERGYCPRRGLLNPPTSHFDRMLPEHLVYVCSPLTAGQSHKESTHRDIPSLKVSFFKNLLTETILYLRHSKIILNFHNSEPDHILQRTVKIAMISDLRDLNLQRES